MSASAFQQHIGSSGACIACTTMPAVQQPGGVLSLPTPYMRDRCSLGVSQFACYLWAVKLRTSYNLQGHCGSRERGQIQALLLGAELVRW